MKQISQREKEVLKNISLGYTINEIAKMLYLSKHTATSQCKNFCSNTTRYLGHQT